MVFLNRSFAPATSAASIACSVFFKKVRIIERLLALCARCFSACLTRFFACLVLANVVLHLYLGSKDRELSIKR